MEVQVQMQGLDQAQKMFLDLIPQTEKEISKAQIQFIDFCIRSAKMRAPSFSGQLSESIVKQNPKKETWQLVVLSPYGWFQEAGFTPNFLDAGMPVQGGYRIGDWMKAKGLSGFGIKPSGKPHPFVQPAFEAGLAQLPIMLQAAVYEGARKAKK